MRLRSAWIAACLSCLIAASAAAREAGSAPPRKVAGEIDNAVVWEGEILVEGTVSVGPGGRLDIRPGSVVRFGREAGLDVAGTLRAEGADGNPVRFRSADPVPSKGAWKGIAFAGTAAGSVLRNAVVSSADAIRVLAGSAEIDGCTIEEGRSGVVVGKGAALRIRGTTIAGMEGNGVDCQAGSRVAVDDCTIRGCGKAGVEAQRNSAPEVRRNTVSGCNVGIRYGSPAPAPEGNRLDNNVAGMFLNNAGDDMSVLGNRFTRNGVGLHAENFSSPRIEGNEFEDNDAAIFCFRSSAPRISRNRIVRNRNGIVCSQLSAARILGNEIGGNGVGVLLTLSSYASANGNNFDNNTVQMKLDNMSRDWERRSGRKPERGAQARNLGRAERGVAPPSDQGGGAGEAHAEGVDFVDATGNWWGQKDTAEMAEKGPAANIGSLLDVHDVPTRTYKGYSGEFAQDRIEYKGWKSSRIPDAGLPEPEGGK